jgi:hypothetical protein
MPGASITCTQGEAFGMPVAGCGPALVNVGVWEAKGLGVLEVADVWIAEALGALVDAGFWPVPEVVGVDAV